jgi:hypothetical protein
VVQDIKPQECLSPRGYLCKRGDAVIVTAAVVAVASAVAVGGYLVHEWVQFLDKMVKRLCQLWYISCIETAQH